MTTINNHPKPTTVSFYTCLKGSWADRGILLALLLGIGFLWLQIQQTLSQGAPTAYVYHGKTLLASYPLPKDNQVIHVNAQGDIGISKIDISRDGVRFVSSPCTTHYCTLSGAKKHAGGVLACVPNRIMAVIRGADVNGNKHMRFDAITE